MKISSWNVNSVRARILNIIQYIKKTKPDILLLQEIKTENITFPTNDFKELGYESHIFGQKSYNGVAFISKIKILNVKTDFIKDKKKQSRIISADIKYKSNIINLINIYVPNGNPVGTDKYDYKKEWLDAFNAKIKKKLLENKNIIIGGDFNIIPDENDVYDHTKYEKDALYRLEIRKKFRELINLGFYDGYRHYNNNVQEYTFWDYMSGAWAKNYGMRIDHFLISTNLLNLIKGVKIDKEPRSKIKPSDHTPIELDII
jgi:exodeoxyribonuclease III